MDGNLHRDAAAKPYTHIHTNLDTSCSSNRHENTHADGFANLDTDTQPDTYRDMDPPAAASLSHYGRGHSHRNRSVPTGNF